MAPRSKIAPSDGEFLTYNGTTHDIEFSNGVNSYTSFQSDAIDWIRWHNDTQEMEILLQGVRHVIDPEHIIGKHALDVGAGTAYEKQHRDLAVIRKKYEAILELNPELRELREEYNDMLEKYKLMDILEKDNNA